MKKAEAFLSELKDTFPDLALKSSDDEFAVYEGFIGFSSNYNGLGLIEDVFQIEITFPLIDIGDPIVKETAGRIPRERDNHINEDGTICLGAPLEVQRKHRQNPTLYGFITEQIIPFLYGFLYQQKHGFLPFGELSHGTEGIKEYYKELFSIELDFAVLEFLKIIVTDNYRGHLPCPCGSNVKLRRCHGPKIRDIKERQQRENFLKELLWCLKDYLDAKRDLPRYFPNKKLFSCLKTYGHDSWLPILELINSRPYKK